VTGITLVHTRRHLHKHTHKRTRTHSHTHAHAHAHAHTRMRAPSVWDSQVTAIVGDFPVTHPAMQGQRTRYAWTAITDITDKKGRTAGIAKFDLSRCGGKHA